MKFNVVRSGGALGETAGAPGPRVVGTFDTKEEAQAKAKLHRKALTPGERKYYRIRYAVVQARPMCDCCGVAVATRFSADNKSKWCAACDKIETV